MKYMRIATLFLTLMAIVLVSGCTDTNEGVQMVEEGDFVKVDYVGKLDDGTIFDTSIEEVAKEAGGDVYNPGRNYTPLGFTVGAGQMIPGFDKGVVGMEVGEEKTIVIPPEEGYGEYREDLVQSVPVDEFKEEIGIEPEEGQMLMTSMGQQVVIKEVNETDVQIDYNHRLAGETLTFDVTIVSVGEE
jgi:FKBP-type peptidyl-prolyl cis-trans isomerase 2